MSTFLHFINPKIHSQILYVHTLYYLIDIIDLDDTWYSEASQRSGMCRCLKSPILGKLLLLYQGADQLLTLGENGASKANILHGLQGSDKIL